MLRETKDACFLSCVEDKSKDKYRYKTKHNHIQTRCRTSYNSGMTLWNSGKENHRASVISHNIRCEGSQAPVAHTCNPSYSGGRDQEDCGPTPAQANTSAKPYLEKPFTN
jgi:hypothetical protein